MPPRRNLRNSILLTLVFLTSVPLASASTTSGTINSVHKYAWSNEAGWINLAPSQGGLTVTRSSIIGYAWSANDGWINFSPAQGGVTNDGAGNLGGFAWDAVLGWVSFTGVTIDSSGKFHGQAAGTNETITFDCANCDVETDWRPVTSSSSGGGGGGSTVSGTTTAASATSTPRGAQPPTPPSSLPRVVPGNSTFEKPIQTKATSSSFNTVPSHPFTPPPHISTTTASTTTNSSHISLHTILISTGLLLLLMSAFFLIRFFF